MPDPTPTTRPLRADARRNRARVLEAAETVLARDGKAASLREVARQAGVGLATIYRQFPTKEALFQAIVVERVRRLLDEARALADADDPGEAFFAFFTRVVADSTDKKILVEALADAGVDYKAGTDMDDLQRETQDAIGVLLARAQRAGAVRDDLAMPELLALLTAACLGAERSQWDEGMRTRALSFMFDGFRPR